MTARDRDLPNNPEDGVVEGIVYEVFDYDIDCLDHREGYPTHYDRKMLKVKLDDGTSVKAITYIAQPGKVKKNLKPTKEYLAHLLKGKKYMSEEYYERLNTTETL